MADPSSSTAVLSFMASWFTPTSLFLFLNLMIGTIIVTSRFTTSARHYQQHHHDGHDGPHPLARAPSLIDRVKSFNFSLYKFDHHAVHAETYYQFGHHQYPETAHFANQVDPPPPLVRAPSLLERLKSVNFSNYRYNHPDQVHQHPEPEPVTQIDHPAPLARAPSLLQRLNSINFSSYWHGNPNPESDPTHHQQRRESVNRTRAPAPPPLARAPSFLKRVQSINFSLYGPENSYPDPEEADPVPEPDHHVTRVNSDTEPRGGEAQPRLPGKMRKSASDKSAFGHFGSDETEANAVELRRPETVKEGKMKKKGMGMAGDEEEEEIDAKADDFINRFKQQLKLQRLDSILRYKEMLGRVHGNH